MSTLNDLSIANGITQKAYSLAKYIREICRGTFMSMLTTSDDFEINVKFYNNFCKIQMINRKKEKYLKSTYNVDRN